MEIFVVFGIMLAGLGAAEIDAKNNPEANIAFLQEQIEASKADLEIQHGQGAKIQPEAKEVAQAQPMAFDPELDGDSVAANDKQ